MSQKEFLKNFNWFPFWFERNFPEIITHILTMLIPFTICYLYLIKTKTTNGFKLYKVKLYLFIFVLLSLLFWLTFSPVYRFGITFFMTAVLLILSNFFSNKKITKNLFMAILGLCLLFNFSKNINRILNNDKIYFGTQNIKNNYVLDDKNSLESSKIFFVDVEKNKFNGWQGRLCWDIPIICSYSDVELEKKRNYLLIKKRKKD